VSSIRRAREAREIGDLGRAREVAGQLAELAVRLPTRAGTTGRLFGSVTTGDVADAVRAAGGPPLDRRRIELSAPIKTLGEHRVQVRLHPEVVANVDVEVVAAS
jgi:large subunit ribosomal protein L9